MGSPADFEAALQHAAGEGWLTRSLDRIRLTTLGAEEMQTVSWPLRGAEGGRPKARAWACPQLPAVARPRSCAAVRTGGPARPQFCQHDSRLASNHDMVRNNKWRAPTGGFRVWTGTKSSASRLTGRSERESAWRSTSTPAGGRVDVIPPILAPLARSIEATKTGDLAFIAGERGRPMAKESFGNWFRKACNAAGVPGSAHGLRKAGATRGRERRDRRPASRNVWMARRRDAFALYALGRYGAARGGAVSKLQKNESRKSIPSPDEKVREASPNP